MQAPRILCVADVFPWPARDGYRIRLAHILKALADCGELDFFAAESRPPSRALVPADTELARFKLAALPSRGRVLTRMLSSALPRRVLAREWDAARRELSAWARAPYDLVWYSHIDTLAGLGPVAGRAAVLDADNLEDMRLRSLRAAHFNGLAAALRRPRRSPEFARELQYRTKGALSTLEAGRWRRVQNQLSRRGDAMVVCSELDKRRLGVPNAVVIPNGYDEPTQIADRCSPGNVMVMVAAFHYPPNSESARFFVRDVLPHIRARIPDATVRLVGRHDGQLGNLDDVDGVVVTGEVEDVADELARARVAVVPLRSGSGTRVKVLEAFASRLPVVSTAIGCEGLDLVPGRHLLVADEPVAFANACVRLLTDEELHDRVTGEAWSLFASRYRWQDIHRLIAQLTGSLTARANAPANVLSRSR